MVFSVTVVKDTTPLTEGIIAVKLEPLREAVGTGTIRVMLVYSAGLQGQCSSVAHNTSAVSVLNETSKYIIQFSND